MRQINSFREFALPRPLLHTLTKIKFETPTPVQAASIPPALEGKDVLGTAQTGTGKTAAFGIPLLASIYKEPGQIGLILAPTRELAAQINQVLRQLSKQLKMHGTVVVGGESFSRQVRDLERGVDYIVATPGRLNDHLEQGTVNLKKVSFLVLDEMDRMLDMGFAPQIKQIMRYIPRKRQTLLFSATLPKKTSDLAMRLLNTPVRVKIEPKRSVVPIKETTVRTTPRDKARIIIDAVKDVKGKVLIFTRTQSRTERVARALGKSGHKVVNLHGGKSQGQRKRAINMFKSGSHPILVATDIAGRGIDVIDVEQVVNYDLPRCREDYIHRIGRTGRNGRSGQAVSFVTSEDEDVEFILTGKKTPKKRSRPLKKGRPRNFRKKHGSKKRSRGRKKRW